MKILKLCHICKKPGYFKRDWLGPLEKKDRDINTDKNVKNMAKYSYCNKKGRTEEHFFKKRDEELVMKN